MDQQEREYFHSIVNKITAIEGKARKLSKMTQDGSLLVEIEKVKNLNDEVKDLLEKYRIHVRKS